MRARVYAIAIAIMRRTKVKTTIRAVARSERVDTDLIDNRRILVYLFAVRS